MAAVLLEIADAVVSDLNTAALSQPVTAERVYLARFDLKAVQTLKVVVVPMSEKLERVARDRSSRTIEIEIGVLKKFAKLEASEIDPLVALVGEIVAFFDGKRLSGYPAAFCQVVESDPVYAADHMEQLRQFTSVVKLTIQVL